MLDVVPFTPDLAAAARDLAVATYAETRARIPALPPDAVVPDLAWFAENGLGVAAVDGGRLRGFLGCVGRIEGFFGPVPGTFAPLHAHGAGGDAADRVRIYERMYTAAAQAWVAAGLLSHAVVAYDGGAAVTAFSRLGFGRRTADAVRKVEPLRASSALDPASKGMAFEELDGDERLAVLPLHQQLTAHLRSAPVLMPEADFDADALGRSFAERSSRVIVARIGAEVVGYLELTADGENFVTEPAGMASICGAFVAPAYRGAGVADGMLTHVVRMLDAEGVTHLGVDYELFNVTASHYWEKHFTPYTVGMTRRIDERIG